MRKKMYFVLLLALVGLCVPAKAILVNIPDANFRAKLQTLYPACFVGAQMETTCSWITSATTLTVGNLNITSLVGVEYFTSLQSLECVNNQLTSLPTLPANLLSLNCSNNQLTSLPTLPVNLRNLYCGVNQLTNFPVLPVGLWSLQCQSNLFISLPTLPSSLQGLFCFNNQLTSLPNLPSGLLSLQCSGNPLTSLPNLPSGLQSLECFNNQLTSLPNLPSGLQNLECSSNQLTSLPSLPSSLQNLYCYNNQLTSLPTLSSGLQNLYCYNNQLTSLPSLPSGLVSLECYSNPLTVLPTLPANLVYLHCYGNQLTSLPFLPSSLQSLYCSNNQLDFADLEAINPKPTNYYGTPQSYKILPITQSVVTGATLSINGGIGGSLNVYRWYKGSEGAQGGTLISGATSAVYTKNNITSADADVYTCLVTSTYMGTGTTTGVSITSSSVTVSVTGLSSQTITLPTIPAKVYGNASFSLGASTTSGLPLTYLSSNTSIATVSATGIVSIVGAGTTNITVSQAGNASYASATTSGTLVVNKASLTMTAEDKTRIVGIANPVFTFTYSGFVLGENENTSNMFTQAPTATSAANLGSIAGVYSIIPIAIAQNYNISFVNGTLTVTNPTPIAQVITLPTISTKTYGDVGFSLGASTTSGLPLTYVSSNTSIATVSATGIVSIVGAGTTNITVSQAGNASYASATTSGTLVVNKASLTMTAEDKTRIVGVANPTFTFTYLGFVLGENQNTANMFTQAPTASTVANSSSVAGTYAITPSAIARNYNITFINGTLTVANPTPIAQVITLPTISTKTYGDVGFSLGASTTSGLLLTYTSDNMSIATVSTTGIVSIIGAGTTNITVSQAGNASYASATISGTLVVNKASLTMTAEDKTRIVGVANPTFTFTYLGFVLGENENTSNMFTQAPTATSVANLGSIAGVYSIIPIAIAQNYNISFINGALTVTNPTPIAQTITLPTISTKIYGDAGFSLGASTTSGLPLTYTSDNTSIATVSATGIVSIVGAGTTNITVSQAGNGGFLPATPVTQVLTILKKDLTVTAQTFSTEACNGTDIYFPLNYSGFVNGETSLNLATLPVGFVGPTKSTTILRVNNTFVPKNGAGKLKNPFVVYTYTISIANGVSNNYNFIYVAGAVTLTECPIWRNKITPTASTETLDNEIMVYPNPSNSDFKIDFGSLEIDKAVIRVYDMQGKQVYTTEIANNINEIKNTTNIAIISLGNMANGIYLLQISTEKGNIQKRIVKAD